MREVDFTPTGVRAWIEGRVLDDAPPAGAPPSGLVFEATGSGQHFIVTADPAGTGESMDALRVAGDSVHTVWGRATALDGVNEVVIYLEGIGETQ